jgi:ribonuclease HI
MNIAIKVPGNKQSNQIGEIAAVIAAAETLPNYCKSTIVSDSRHWQFEIAEWQHPNAVTVTYEAQSRGVAHASP